VIHRVMIAVAISGRCSVLCVQSPKSENLPEGQPGRVYAGISVAGFFRSDDGATWTPANEGTSAMAEFVAGEFVGGKVEDPGVHRCVH